MVLDEIVYGVSHETEPTSFQDAISGPESKEWIEAIQSEVCSQEEEKLGNLAVDLMEGR